jgi:CubicO group peptidase (beta-lactamase class C family)
MKLTSVLAGSAIALAGAVAAAPLPRAASPEAVGLSSERLQRITRTFQRDVDEKLIPGAVVLLARNGQIAYLETFGYRDRTSGEPMTADSIFRIASMTKPITAVAALMLAEEGRLQLMDPVARYLPQLEGLKVGVEKVDGSGERTLLLEPAKRPVTVQDLMRHTSGMTYGPFGDSLVQRAYREAAMMDDQQTNAEMVSKLARLPLAFQPGTAFEYGMSTDVLGRIVEVVSGLTLDRFVAERIFAPLGMRDTAFVLDDEQTRRLAQPQPLPGATVPVIIGYNPARPPKWFAGGHGLLSTAEDYARFCQMLLNGGKLDGVSILSRKSVELMTSNHLPPGIGYGAFTMELGLTAPLPQLGQGYGLGVGVRLEPGRSTVPGSTGDFYWGGATGPYFWVDPEEQLIAIMMMQESDIQRRTHYRSVLRNLVYQALE